MCLFSLSREPTCVSSVRKSLLQDSANTFYHTASAGCLFSTAADCTVGDLISWDKLTLQGLILQPCELSQSGNLIIGVGASVMHRPQMVAWSLSCSESPQGVWLQQSPASAGNRTSSCVQASQFVYDGERSVMRGTTPERIGGINLLCLSLIFRAEKQQKVFLGKK